MTYKEGEINIEAIVKIASCKYSRKYKYLMDDIIQEGWVAALSYIDRKEGLGEKVTPSGVLGAVKKEIYKFANLKQLPVTVAVNSDTVEKFKNGEASFQGVVGCELLEEAVEGEAGKFMQEFKGDEDVVRSLVDVVLQGQLKEVIKLRYFEEKSTYEVAEILGMSQSTVSRREHEALNILFLHM